jgi:hypothetical protein
VHNVIRGYDHGVTVADRVSRWYQGRSFLAVLARAAARLVRPRPGWLSSGAGAIAVLTAWQLHPVAAGAVAVVVLLLAEWRVAGRGVR